MLPAGGAWPVGVVSSWVTLRVGGLASDAEPVVRQECHRTEGGYGAHVDVQTPVRDGDEWLVTLQLAPARTVHVLPQGGARG